jgi:Putative DNA-binding domain
MVESDLSVLQEWMLAACTSAGGASKGLCVSSARDALEASAVVKGSGPLTPEDRLDIYARGYLARLLGCLRAEFPALHALVGDQVFDLFAHGYIGAHSPGSYSLFDLGAGFPDFLQETRPRPLGPAGSLDALPAALARLERARLEARHAPGVETDPAHRPIDPLTVMATPNLTVRTPESLRLLRLDFALTDTLTAADRSDRPAVPPPADTHYAVARSHYHVRVHVLTPWQHTFLQTCPTSGVPLDIAVATTARNFELDPTDIWAALVTWLPLAVDAGMTTVRQGPLSGSKWREVSASTR